jgi:quercetin dioxygenase-like cupin family protein
VAVGHSRSASASAAGGAEHAIVPIEIRRFGVGHRRPGGPIGSVGLSGQVLHSDGRGNVSELAFARNARTEAHANPNTSLFIVVEGGGWVGVDGERTRIAAGEAAVWPADVPHAAWTEHSEMRAFIVEFAGADDRDTVEGRAREAGDDTPVMRGTGELAARTARSVTPGSDEGEPA